MPQTRILNIESLQPTELDLKQQKLDSLVSTPVAELPEVWKINNQYVIADGHHKLHLMTQQGIKKARVLFYSEKNTLANYAGVLPEIEKYAQECKERGINTLSDLQIN